MSESAGHSSSVSSVSSISLVEIKAETHLVLQAFLEQTLSTPHKDRPGRVGGAYDDQNKYSFKPQSKSKLNDGHNYQTEDEDKNSAGIRDFIKHLPHRNTIFRSKDPKGSLTKISKTKHSQREDTLSPSSSSDEDDSEKKWRRHQISIRKKLNLFFKKKVKEKKERDKEQRPDEGGPHPQRPTDLPTAKEPDRPEAILSPNHPPQFYTEVAGKLEKIAKKSTKIKILSPVLNPPADEYDQEAVAQQLVHLVCSEGDSMNAKIQENPFLRNSLNRLSYASFAKLLDFVGSNEVSEAPPLPPSGSPTLRRVAVSMEVSRRIITATGAQRTKDYAERYMESFAPWVKSHGGWGNVLDIEDLVEYD